MPRHFIAALSLLAVMSAGQAATPLGEINIELRGNIVDLSCVVNASDSAKEVQLGSWPTKQLLTAGSKTQAMPFSIRLTGCPPGAVSITFAGKPDSQDNTLLALNSTSQASRVAVEILDEDKSRLPLQQESKEVATDAQGDATLSFYANYISTADDPQPGSADADATFTLNYN
ncbi:fimbria assembly protein [Pseudocitrobacter cyperus]|uniref:Fimbria assembly protein n=1 Tax=Pseudocitrobacter cyperus TaxID=3112843 RepID=A0ABV0HGM8_9ENTR